MFGWLLNLIQEKSMIYSRQTSIWQFQINCTNSTDDDFFSNDCTKTAKNSIFYYKHRTGCSTEIFNQWKVREDIEIYSRADMKRVYRLGDGFWCRVWLFCKDSWNLILCKKSNTYRICTRNELQNRRNGLTSFVEGGSKWLLL